MQQVCKDRSLQGLTLFLQRLNAEPRTTHRPDYLMAESMQSECPGGGGPSSSHSQWPSLGPPRTLMACMGQPVDLSPRDRDLGSGSVSLSLARCPGQVTHLLRSQLLRLLCRDLLRSHMVAHS